MHVFIDGGNIGTELSNFVLGLCESRGQGIEAGLKAWLWVWTMMKRKNEKG